MVVMADDALVGALPPRSMLTVPSRRAMPVPVGRSSSRVWGVQLCSNSHRHIITPAVAVMASARRRLLPKLLSVILIMVVGGMKGLVY